MTPASGSALTGFSMSENGGVGIQSLALKAQGARAGRAHTFIAQGRRISGHLPDPWGRRARDFGKALVNYRGARRSYPRQMLFALLKPWSDVLLVPFGRGRLLVPSDDDEIGRVVFVTGGYERIYMERAVDELRRLGHEVEGKTFVDVGANIGTSTVDALVGFGFGRAVCFEPDERSYRLLKANIALNGLDERVVAYPIALSDAEAFSVLQTSTKNRGDNRLLLPDEAPVGDASNVVSVPCRRFDDLVAEGAIVVEDVGLMWVDAQGHEPFVLGGASTALEAGLPLVVEFAPAALGAGGVLGELEQMIMKHYTTVIDLHRLVSGLSSDVVFDAADIGEVRDMGGQSHTDLLLVRLPASVA